VSYKRLGAAIGGESLAERHAKAFKKTTEKPKVSVKRTGSPKLGAAAAATNKADVVASKP
jgi:hypothetical protein